MLVLGEEFWNNGLATSAIKQICEFVFENSDIIRIFAEPFAHGFDALKNVYTDMVESGIIDPTKVSRSVLQNAASVAATLLTTESIVTDIPTAIWRTGASTAFITIIAPVFSSPCKLATNFLSSGTAESNADIPTPPAAAPMGGNPDMGGMY